MAVACSAGAHISKSQLIVCIIGFVGFTILALGAVSDYWVTYGITAGSSPGSNDGPSAPSSQPTAVLSREGLWRVCLQYVAYNTTSITDHMCFFGLSVPESVSMSSGEKSMTRYEVGFLIGSWVLYGVGVVLTLVAVVMAIAALRNKKNRALIRGVAAMFFTAVVFAFLGLVIYAVRTSKFLGQWPDDGGSPSPYSSENLSWSFGISWFGLVLCLTSGIGHLWVVRRYEDTML